MATFRILKGRAISYGPDGKYLATPGHEDKLDLTPEQIDKLRRKKVIEMVETEPAARESAAAESAPATTASAGARKSVREGGK